MKAIQNAYLHDAHFHARCEVAWQYVATGTELTGVEERTLHAAIVTALYVDEQYRKRTEAEAHRFAERRTGRIGAEEALTDAAADATFYGDGFVRAKRFEDGSLLWERVDPTKVILIPKEE